MLQIANKCLAICYRIKLNQYNNSSSLHSITVWNKIQFHTWMYKKGCGKAVCITELCIPTIGRNFLHSSLVTPKKFTKSSSVLPLSQRELYNTELSLQGGGRGQKKTTFPALSKQARIVLLENPGSNCRKKLEKNNTDLKNA